MTVHLDDLQSVQEASNNLLNVRHTQRQLRMMPEPDKLTVHLVANDVHTFATVYDLTQNEVEELTAIIWWSLQRRKEAAQAELKKLGVETEPEKPPVF